MAFKYSAKIGACIQRNSPGFGAGLTKMEDVYRAWLKSKGGSGTHLMELEYSFFIANGGSGRSYHDAKGSFCAAKGFTAGRNAEENWRSFLDSGAV